MEAIILAGGFGRRLRSVVNDRPKPMALINKKPFLEYLIRYWLQQKITKIIFAVGYMQNHIIDYFQDKFLDIPIEYAIENVPLGTGGALFNAIEKLQCNNPVLVMNGDTFAPLELNTLVMAHQKNSADITLVVRRMKNTRYGSLHLDKSNKILSFTSKATGSYAYINSGIYLLNKPISLKKERLITIASLETDLFPLWVKEKNIYAYIADQSFVDIGIPESYDEAGSIIEKYIHL